MYFRLTNFIFDTLIKQIPDYFYFLVKQFFIHHFFD